MYKFLLKYEYKNIAEKLLHEYLLADLRSESCNSSHKCVYAKRHSKGMSCEVCPIRSARTNAMIYFEETTKDHDKL